MDGKESSEEKGGKEVNGGRTAVRGKAVRVEKRNEGRRDGRKEEKQRVERDKEA